MTPVARPSPNHGPRPEGAPVDLVVIHYTAMGGGWGPALTRLTAEESGVSAHWLIGEGGETFAMVPEARRAWHAKANDTRGSRGGAEPDLAASAATGSGRNAAGR